MKRLILLLTITSLFVSTLSLSAEETKKFPGKFFLSILQRVDVQTTGDKIGGNTKFFDDDVYLRTEIKSGIVFPINKIFVMVPWVKDRFESRFNFAPIWAYIADRYRNRVYFGLNNVIKIKGVMDIGLNAELRIENEIRDSSVLIKPTVIRFSPFVSLSGKYKLGIFWNVTQFFEMFFIPANNTTTAAFNEFDLEGFYTAGFEFFHFFAPKQIKGSVVLSDYLLLSMMNIVKGTKVTLPYTEFYGGLNFNIYGFIAKIGSFFWVGPYGMDIQNNLDKLHPHVGLQAGIGFKKEWLSVSFTYTGGIDATPTAGVTPEWEGEFSSSAAISL